MKEFKTTTARIRMSTMEELRQIIKDRKRNECIDQVIKQLIEDYYRLKGLDK